MEYAMDIHGLPRFFFVVLTKIENILKISEIFMIFPFYSGT